MIHDITRFDRVQEFAVRRRVPRLLCRSTFSM
jgi:hypothetical protein